MPKNTVTLSQLYLNEQSQEDVWGCFTVALIFFSFPTSIGSSGEYAGLSSVLFPYQLLGLQCSCIFIPVYAHNSCCYLLYCILEYSIIVDDFSCELASLILIATLILQELACSEVTCSDFKKFLFAGLIAI